MDGEILYNRHSTYFVPVKGKRECVLIDVLVVESHGIDGEVSYVESYHIFNDGSLDSLKAYSNRDEAIKKAEKDYESCCSLIENLGGEIYETVRTDSKLQQPA